MIQDKAQFAVNGYSLNKDWNAVLSHLWASLRARREAVILRCRLRAPTLGAPLGKDQPFPARRPRLKRLLLVQLTAFRHAESAINYDAVH